MQRTTFYYDACAEGWGESVLTLELAPPFLCHALVCIHVQGYRIFLPLPPYTLHHPKLHSILPTYIET